ncbi:haloacid dehalogenase [Auriculariales sp. MPI-PUGE-AT-0066]|nr:haloacid dehalogenase [Auriculariales sp. MPI-PUGE-AT-0066]
MSNAQSPPDALVPVKALVFDIMGTMTDCLSPLRDALDAHAPAGEAAQYWNAEQFARDWRAGVTKRTKEGYLSPEEIYRSVFDGLCAQRGIDHIVWDDAIRKRIVDAWRNMPALIDTVRGMDLLRTKYILVGLTNNSAGVMVDVHKKAGMNFDLLLTANIVEAFKPNPRSYQAVLSALGLKGGEVAMVAAHSYDLRAAREHCGFRTLYVERATEMPLEPEDSRDMDVLAREFDVVIRETPDSPDGGLVALARALGIVFEDDTKPGFSAFV